MNAFLIEYGNKGEKREVFRQIERQIREAVDEAEDTLDACLTQKAKAPSLLSPNINIDLAKKVKDLRLELQPIFKRAMKGLKALPIADGSATRPATSDNYKLQKVFLFLSSWCVCCVCVVNANSSFIFISTFAFLILTADRKKIVTN